MRKSLILKVAFFVSVAFGLWGCSLAQINPLAEFKTAGFLNGQMVTTTKDATLWQCPGGSDAGGDMLNCVEQHNLGTAVFGTSGTVLANDTGQFARYGFVRVSITIHYTPTWDTQQREIVETNVGWINASDVK